MAHFLKKGDFTEEVIRDCFARRLDGQTNRDIAYALGRHVRVINSMFTTKYMSAFFPQLLPELSAMRDATGTWDRRPNQKTDEEKRSLVISAIELSESGLRNAEIAAELGLSGKRLRALLSRKGMAQYASDLRSRWEESVSARQGGNRRGKSNKRSGGRTTRQAGSKCEACRRPKRIADLTFFKGLYRCRTCLYEGSPDAPKSLGDQMYDIRIEQQHRNFDAF